MNKSSFFIVGQHAVIEALRNPKRKVLRVFLTEESKKNIHRKNPNKNLLNDVKVYLAVQIGDIKDRMSGEHQLITNNQSKIVADKGEELALAIMNKLLVELTEKTE